ncbi:MAG: WD40/YVTN/BNR-like repeat-containing protein [Pseudobdellovibrionaceae bacterium]
MKAFLATRKGLIVMKPVASGWDVEKAHFDGVKVTYVVADSKKAGWVWAGLNHGHWGPKLHVSKNKGKTFEEVATPTFPESGKDKLREIWAVTRDSKGRIYVGTDPAALFYSDDDGKSWTLLPGFYNIDTRDRWVSGGTEGACAHSILINPEDDNNMIVGISVGGVLETKDRGKTWKYITKGMKAYFMPNPDEEVTQDPHLVERAPSNPNVLWQQNHCGIYKSENGGQDWKELNKAKGVKSAFGWAVAIDEKNADIAYTIPALSDETRVPVQKKLIVQKTTNGGKSWKVISKGLPQKHCYDIVLRHALSKNNKNLIFGSSTGHVYFSKNEGESWKQLKHQFAPIYAVKFLP